MKKLKMLLLLAMLLSLLPGMVFATGQQEKPKVTFYWALYDGLTEDFRASLQDAFMKANPDINLDIVPVPWKSMHDKITTSLAGGNPPEISVIGTRWLLELMGLNAVDEVTPYVSKSTLDNIAPGAMEAKIKGKLMGLPVAAGARIMAINTSITNKVPMTMEELEKDAMAVNNPPNVYGLIMPGKKHTELTDFAYYLLAAGGYFFDINSDGSYGKCAVNSPAGVKALTFMNKLANVDKVVQKGYLSMDRMASHPVFYAGKAAYVFIGAWVESAMKQAKSNFKVKYAQIPPFAGNKSTPLIITDSIAIFKDAKYKKEAGKFLDFFYQDKWKAKFDELVGFPPVTISASKLPQFQTPLYKALGVAALHAKGWPLMDGWAEYSDIIWDANQKVFLGQMTPKAALDEAAAKIDKARGM